MSIFVPTAFSPNGDGENDVFYVRGNDCLAQMSIKIFDRWGELVFQTTNPGAGWNGVYNGKLEDSAVFVYYLTATLTTGKSITSKGNVTLLR